MSTEWLVGLLFVFTRFTAMALAAPVLGGQSLSVQIRIMASLAISAAIHIAIGPSGRPVPETMVDLVAGVAQEAIIGLTIGFAIQLVIQALTMAGALMDLQIGLGMSQTVNPVTGISITVLGQLKTMLGLVIFFASNGHHQAIRALVHSFGNPNLTPGFASEFAGGIATLLTGVFLIALQIAAPVIAITLVVDAAFGLLNRAVPQLQAMTIAIPAKTLGGLLLIALALPAAVTGVSSGLEMVFRTLDQATAGGLVVR